MMYLYILYIMVDEIYYNGLLTVNRKEVIRTMRLFDTIQKGGRGGTGGGATRNASLNKRQGQQQEEEEEEEEEEEDWEVFTKRWSMDQVSSSVCTDLLSSLVGRLQTDAITLAGHSFGGCAALAAAVTLNDKDSGNSDNSDNSDGNGNSDVHSGPRLGSVITLDPACELRTNR